MLNIRFNFAYHLCVCAYTFIVAVHGRLALTYRSIERTCTYICTHVEIRRVGYWIRRACDVDRNSIAYPSADRARWPSDRREWARQWSSRMWTGWTASAFDPCLWWLAMMRRLWWWWWPWPQSLHSCYICSCLCSKQTNKHTQRSIYRKQESCCFLVMNKYLQWIGSLSVEFKWKWLQLKLNHPTPSQPQSIAHIRTNATNYRSLFLSLSMVVVAFVVAFVVVVVVVVVFISIDESSAYLLSICCCSCSCSCCSHNNFWSGGNCTYSSHTNTQCDEMNIQFTRFASWINTHTHTNLLKYNCVATTSERTNERKKRQAGRLENKERTKQKQPLSFKSLLTAHTRSHTTI